MTSRLFVPHARQLYAGLIAALIASLILPLAPSMPARADIAPVLHLPLDESAGATTFADLSVYNHPGACSGASCPTTGIAGMIIVTSTLDSGAGTLRQAIADAAPGDTILFDNSLSGLTITLSSQLAIAKNLTIDGSALPVTITLNGNHATRILFISSGARVTLNRLQFSAGAVNVYNEGGGLYIASGAVVTLTHSAVLSCTAGWGGGIYGEMATLTVQDSTFAGNSATSGGGITNGAGTLTVQGSTFTGNSGDSGGGIYNIMGTLTVQDSTFTGNSVTGSGGGIYSEETTLTVRDSTFYGNRAWGGGGFTATRARGRCRTTRSSQTRPTGAAAFTTRSAH